MDAKIQGKISFSSAATNVFHNWGGCNALIVKKFEINMISGISGTKWGNDVAGARANYAVAMHAR
jgi:hypothetical protein